MASSSRRGQKRTYICISSSSSSDEDEDGYKPQSKSEYRYGDGGVVEITSSSSCDIDDDESDDDESDCDEGDIDGSCDRVIRGLRDKSDLQELKLVDCRSYLRHHGLRTTGTKTECVERIMEHWRIKDGNAEALYPRSSFVLDCTGDVCRGDVVLFKQKTKMFNRQRTKQWRCIRTVAGRVVRESYGAGKQQHTFTIEVSWSKGGEQLQPLSILLIKGRKLYKMKTFRQPWKNEAERQRVLAEKHERGDAARLTRAINKVGETACSRNKGVKRQKHFLQATSSKSNKRTNAKRGNQGKSNNHLQKTSGENLKKKSKARSPDSSTKNKISNRPCKFRTPIAQSYPYSSQNFHQPQMHPNIPFHHHHPHQNVDRNSHVDPFFPQNFHHHRDYQDPHDLQFYRPQDFHLSQWHHDTRFLSHHSQDVHSSQVHHHYQHRNVGRVSPHYFDPPVSRNRGLNYDYSRSNVFDPRM